MLVQNTIRRGVCAVLIAVVVGALGLPGQASAASVTSAQLREAQTILTRLKIPTGPIDGVFGGQTARGLCAFRIIAGMSPSRSNLDASLLAKLRAYNTTYSSLQKIPAPTRNGEKTYVRVNETCQVLLYVENGHYTSGGAIAVSTGKPGHDTPNGTYSKQGLGYTEKGWKCSGDYPDNPDGTCKHQTSGRFATSTSRGNMYNRRHVTGGIFVHGSTSVPTYPASHGCIRVPVSASDWMYDHIGNTGRPTIIIEGSYPGR